jgi:hypothetical protein
MDSNKALQVKGLLGGLPPLIAARLAKAIEIDRLNGGTALPHETILDGLRPVLRRGQQSDRAPTPLRLFCRPFEDLLTMMPRKEKQKGRIARASIMPVWNWVSQTLIPNAASAFSIGVKTATLSGNTAEALAQASKFWEIAAQAIFSALDGERDRKAARAVLESDLVLADAREMAVMMSAGDEIVNLQTKGQRLLPSLTEDYIWILREIYDRLIATVPDAAPYVAVVAMHRLERPWEALKLSQHITRQTQDTLISSTDMGLVGEILFGDIEYYTSMIRGMRPQHFDADQLTGHIANFTALSSGMVKTIDMRRDGKWGQRLLKDRTDVAEVMDSYMERAEKEVAAALPTIRSGGYGGGPRVPDVANAPDPEKSDRALGYVRLITGCRLIAPAASFGASNKDAEDAVALHLKAYVEDLLKELRAAEGDRRTHAEQFFHLTVEMTALLYGQNEAELLRRRGRAAMPIAA